MKKEVWKTIEEYPRYSVSNQGRVRNNKTGKIIKPFRIGSKGQQYYAVDLYPKKSVRVHRLVAKAFISNPESKREVNHIDGNKLNNSVENLEWVTGSENCKHAYDVLGRKKFYGSSNCYSKRIMRIEDGKVYGSLSEAVKDLNLSSHSHISLCLHGKRNTAAGYHWQFVDEEDVV